MATLGEVSLTYSGKKEITELDKVPIATQIYEGTFKNKQGQDIKYYYIELNGIQYNIKSQILTKIKELLLYRQQTKSIKVNKGADGQYSVIPLD